MKMRNFGCALVLLFSLSGCAGHSATPNASQTSPTSSHTSSTYSHAGSKASTASYAPVAHQYVALRSFHIRQTPKLSGAEILRINEGESLYAVIEFHDRVWNYIRLDNGSEGYIFGMPLTPQK